MQNESTHVSRLDGHKLSEFIYGTIIGMVAIVGLGGGDETSWFEAALIIITGSAAIWLAHAYSMLLAVAWYRCVGPSFGTWAWH